MRFSWNPKHTAFFLHALIWGGILAFPFFIRTEQEVFPAGFTLITNVIHLGLFYFNAYYLYPRLMTSRRWWLYLLSLIAIIGGTFRFKLLILNVLFPEISFLEYMNAYLGFPLIVFLVLSIIYRIVLDQINYEKKLRDREAEQLSTELKFLRSQISPHFLFNVLNNMVSMARHKSDRLEPSLIRLAELMRYMLYESDTKKVPLTREIEYLKSYIELQKIRFEADMPIMADLLYEGGPETLEPMLLIPFVENAFKHGLALVDEPFIRIKLEVMEKRLLFSVENSYSPEAAQSKDMASGIGLANIKARLQLLYPGQHVLTVKDEDGIFSVSLTLPLN
jgi:hypothetical protein